MAKMKNILFYTLKLSLLLCVSATFANTTVYQTKEKNGTTLYSDTPKKNSQTIIVGNSGVNSDNVESNPKNDTEKAGNTADNISPTSSTPSTPPTKATATPVDYKLSITSPDNEATFQNQLPIPVSVSVSPKLQNGDQIQLIIDGKPYGQPGPSTTVSITGLERGTHRIQAGIFDNKTKTITKVSTPITIYKHQRSTALNTNPKKTA